MVFILQYKKKALGCSLRKSQNIDKLLLSSVSGTILTLQVPILGSGLMILQTWGVVIDRCQIRSGQIPKWGAANPTVGTQTQRVSAPPPSGV